jgi:hypothetical protein
MVEKIDKIIFGWIMLLFAPPATLILTIEFAKIFFNLKELFWGISIIFMGIVLSILEVIRLISQTKEVLRIK